MSEKRMLIGLNVFDKKVLSDHPAYVLPTENGTNIDFAVCHMDAMRYSMSEACAQAEAISKKLAENGVQLIANFEWQNGCAPTLGPDDFNWAEHEDGTHRLILPERYIASLLSGGNLAGMIYDEFEHVIININASIRLQTKGKVCLNAFAPAESGGALEQNELLCRQLHAYTDEFTQNGIPAMAGEHVFPVLYHLFARNGIIPNFKSQKESFTTVQFAIAAGAALQYGLPLWNCIDSWFMNTHPGHSPEEMEANLLFAYLAGVNRVYVESISPMEKDGALTPYGEKFIHFSNAYRGKERNYDISDFTPEIGVIRFDDTHWGASGILWKKTLFGNKRLRPKRASREYLRVFHLLTHGETNMNGISWGRLTPWSLRRHRSFASLNNAAVFDERVGRKPLESLKLVFLCGEYISPETVSHVEALVRENGLIAVTTKKHLPQRLRKHRKGIVSALPDGSGTWIVTPGFLNPLLKRKISPMLGKKGEIRLTFKNTEIRMKIAPDGDSFTWEKR